MMKPKQAVSALLVLGLVLTGCGAKPSSSPGADHVPNPNRYDLIDRAMAFHAELKSKGMLSGFTDEEIAEAREGLSSAGIMTEEELSVIASDEAASRAQFIQMIVAAAGGELPEPGELRNMAAWYAPYVQTGYDMDIFPATRGGGDWPLLPARRRLFAGRQGLSRHAGADQPGGCAEDPETDVPR